MKKLIPVILCCSLLPALAQAGGDDALADNPGDAHGRNMPADHHSPPAGPPPGEPIREYAIDSHRKTQIDFGVRPIHDNQVFSTVMVDRLEYRAGDDDDILLWDVQAWIGNDYDKLYLKGEGEQVTGEEVEESSLELLYSRNVGAFWDLQAGFRYDFEPRPTRAFLAFGAQGLAPQWFEVDLTAYVSDEGDISAMIEAEYDLLLSQRLILQPRLEAGLAVQDVEEYETGSGITDISLGLRLRYEISRKFAPYLGVSWTHKIGETGSIVRDEGGDVETASFVAGVRMWF